MWRDRSIPWLDSCILRRDGYLQFLLVNLVFTSFPVHRIDDVDSSGHVTTVTYCLSPDSVTIARGYDTMREDPNIYKTFFLWIFGVKALSQHAATCPWCS